MGSGDVDGRAKNRRGDFSMLRCEPPPLYQPPPPTITNTVVGAVSLAAAICLIYLLFEQSHMSTQLSSSSAGRHSSFHAFKSDDLTPQKIVDDGNELESILERASMKNEKTVIITTVNAAWAKPSSMFDLFLESLKNGNQTQRLIQHLVVVAFDKVAYSRCSALHPNCFALTTEGVDFSGNAKFLTDDYLKMMWRRIDFLLFVLQKGYNFIFSDVDVMWMRNPFERFYPEGDFQIACDVYGNSSTNRHNFPNGGFVYVRSNPRTIEFYKYWIARAKAFPKEHDQHVLNMIKFEPFIDEIGLDMRFLDTVYFGGICEPSRDLDLVVTMHVNCCMSLGSKLHDCRNMIADWKRYMRDDVVEEKKKKKKRSWTSHWLCLANATSIKEMKEVAKSL